METLTMSRKERLRLESLGRVPREARRAERLENRLAESLDSVDRCCTAAANWPGKRFRSVPSGRVASAAQARRGPGASAPS